MQVLHAPYPSYKLLEWATLVSLRRTTPMHHCHFLLSLSPCISSPGMNSPSFSGVARHVDANSGDAEGCHSFFASDSALRQKVSSVLEAGCHREKSKSKKLILRYSPSVGAFPAGAHADLIFYPSRLLREFHVHREKAHPYEKDRRTYPARLQSPWQP